MIGAAPRARNVRVRKDLQTIYILSVFPLTYCVEAGTISEMIPNLLPSDCSHCDDGGFDYDEDNFCSCPEGDKLLRKEMATAETFEHDLD